MREIKFRYWDKNNKEMHSTGMPLVHGDCPVMQYTGPKDKNGKDLYSGDLVNVFFTSSDGEHVHDCIYRVSIHDLYGITLSFEKLLWESYGYNQYPCPTEFSSRYNNIDYDYKNQSYDRLAIKDKWNENDFHRQKWKAWKDNDYSNYIEIIGNIYENPELLKQINEEV